MNAGNCVTTKRTLYSRLRLLYDTYFTCILYMAHYDPTAFGSEWEDASHSTSTCWFSVWSSVHLLILTPQLPATLPCLYPFPSGCNLTSFRTLVVLPSLPPLPPTRLLSSPQPLRLIPCPMFNKTVHVAGSMYMPHTPSASPPPAAPPWPFPSFSPTSPGHMPLPCPCLPSHAVLMLVLFAPCP